ncbi:reprolysin-like metallopeptidase [Pareuzebyella sediminis]|uniref:reprolysin-like metallopeptidase n=1 Tax=Pareuzebyella sediminis TaxID=2607998 RepID=UPI0011ED8CE1|nr:zinc-dependent metalloprotease family protein [Pareuzebyella sediminis]
MLTKLRLLFSTAILFFSFYVSAQGEYWKKTSMRGSFPKEISKRLDTENGKIFMLEEGVFKRELETVSKAAKRSKVIYFPDVSGKMVAYRVFETPVLAADLTKKYPEIRSYTGHSLDNQSDKIRLSVSHKDIQAMIVHGDGSQNSFIQKASTDQYILYSRNATSAKEANFICATKDKVSILNASISAKPVNEQVLRKYRLAVSATAEYSTYHGGTVADALAGINATLTRINEVFERDLAVTLELVADTDKVIYTDTETDPYGGSLSTLGSEGQQAFTDEIGEQNYDIGHVFHKGFNGGNAGFIGAICVDNKKGSAYASSEVPEGDIFDLDFVAHEMGHQLGANHTWSYELEGTLVQVEPGSGSTIMGYAGITENDNVQSQGDDYFHYVSIEQIIENLKTKSCGEVISILNNPPEVSPIGDFVIPKSTAFQLTGSATDPDGDMLTYAWEQIDNGVVTRATFGPTNPGGANFRSRAPSTDPTRYFPLLSRVMSGNLTQVSPSEGAAWETASDVEREMNFAFTVRDNAVGGGQVVSRLVNVFVSNSAGPFQVTSHTDSATYIAGEKQQITWDVAETNLMPVNTQAVDILLSTDGGQTFPHILAQNVVNDGSHDIVVPGLPTDEARIMVKAAGNIFYAVNESDFVIEASEIVMNFSELEFEVCHFTDLTIPFTYETFLGFTEEVTFSIDDAPVGLGVSFVPSTATSNGTKVELLFEDTENVPQGHYPITITATSASVTKNITAVLNIYDNTFSDVLLLAPVNGLEGVSTGMLLQWEENSTYTSYEVEIATDISFTNIVEATTVAVNSYVPTGLENETTYFWRVKPLNICGSGNFNTPFSFTTLSLDCDNKSASDLPLSISSFGRPKIVSKVAFFEDLPVSDIKVNLNIDHSFLADLVVRLTSPAGTTVTLISNSCGELQNLNATFDDSASSFICGAQTGIAISGTVKPLGALSSFKGESIFGEWILEVSDNASSDGGSLNSFSLDICVEGSFRPDADNDGVFDDGDDLCLGTPEGIEVNASGCPINYFPNDNFSILVQSESCRNNDDGSVFIEAMLPLDYIVNIVGNGLDVTDSFTESFMLTDLTSGTYTLCIEGSDANFEYEPYCFDVVVVQPEPLGVTSKISDDGKQVVIAMTGSDRYTIELNGKVIHTEKSEMTLDLGSGTNILRVSTNLPCQGIFEDHMFVTDQPIVFPNPFDERTQVFLGETHEKITVDVFTIDGQWIRSSDYYPITNKIDLEFAGIPPGIYFVKFKGDNIQAATKLIKR